MIKNLIWIVILIAGPMPVFGEQQKNRTDLNDQFIEHCESETLTQDQKFTLTSLFNRYRVDTCEKLHKALTSGEYQNISKLGIKDVTILKYVAGLKRLSLDNNEIADLTLFEDFDELTYLSLMRNKISDLRPLLKMKSLQKVFLYKNPVVKESEECPINTHLKMLNEFCFDEKSFENTFRSMRKETKPDVKDIQGILNLTINYPGLEIFYHADVIPERSPLHIYVHRRKFPKADLKMKKFGEMIIVHDQPAKHALDCDITIRGHLSTVVFDYPPEGVFGNFKLERENGIWRILKSTIYE